MHRRSHLRFFLLRWHRRIGVFLGVFLGWMVISGMLLNHAPGLHLDTRLVESAFWLKPYGSEPPGQFRVGGHAFLHTGRGLLDGEQNLGRCDVLLGMAPLPDMTLIACDSRILLLSPTGELVEQSDDSSGLPTPLEALGLQGSEVIIRRQGQNYRFNAMDMGLQAFTGNAENIIWQDTRMAPAAISRERLIQDLHSGRILGSRGPWLVDFLGVAVLMLVLSGWFLARKKHHRA